MKVKVLYNSSLMEEEEARRSEKKWKQTHTHTHTHNDYTTRLLQASWGKSEHLIVYSITMSGTKQACMETYPGVYRHGTKR